MGRQGFTLVELLVVLAVGSILLAIAVPGYAYLLHYNRLAGLTNGLVGSLQLARSEAIKRGMRVTVCKSSTSMEEEPACDKGAKWQQGWLVFVDGGTAGTLDTGDHILKVHGQAPSGAFIKANNYSHYASYLPGGVSQGSNGLGNGTFTICMARSNRSIIINTIGRIRISEKITC